MTPSGWRAQRPFWGGLFLLLSGVELFVSGNLKLALEVHFGPTGFLSYVLPVIMLLCGALTWFSPQQRLFYGILGTVVALYALIGLNLGGFFLGTVLGLVGGGLAVAWTPAADATAAPDALPAPPAPAAYEDTPLDDFMAPDPEAWDRPPSGVLRDEIPTAQYSPLHDRYEGNGAGSADEQLPPSPGPGDLPKRRYLGPLLMVVAVTVSLVATVNRGGPAYAAPAACPSSPAANASNASAAAPKASSAAPPPSSAAPAPSPSPTKGSGGLLGWLGDLFTGGDGDNDPTAAASTSAGAPAAAATPPAPPAASATAKPTAKPAASACASASASPTPNNKKAQIAAGQPFVAAQPSILKADVMTMDALTYDGVADLPRKDGSTVKVLAFSMKNSVSTPFELDTPGGPKPLITRSSKLTVEGDVKFYTTKFSANVLGLLPLTFTPSFPPPPIPLPGFYTACVIELVFVQSNVLTAPALSIASAG